VSLYVYLCLFGVEFILIFYAMEYVFVCAVTQRSLLVLEWLLLSELISPDRIAIISSQTLIYLYTSDSVNHQVQQKARKVADCRLLLDL